MPALDALDTFPALEAARIEQCIDRFIPHLLPDSFVFVGNLAIRYHVAKSDQDYPARPFNDLDIILKSPTALQTTVAEDFRISHYHPQDNYWAIVDPETRVKIDVFRWPPSDPAVFKAPYKDTWLPIQSAEDQLAHIIFRTRKIRQGQCIEPKQFSDAELLMRLANHDQTYRILETYEGAAVPPPLHIALDEAHQIAASRPELVVPNLFHRNRTVTCSGCSVTAAYPLTSLPVIYDLLGE